MLFLERLRHDDVLDCKISGFHLHAFACHVCLHDHYWRADLQFLVVVHYGGQKQLIVFIKLLSEVSHDKHRGRDHCAQY